MGWNTIVGPTAGQPTLSSWAQDVTENINMLREIVGIARRKTTSQSIPDASYTAISLDTEDVDEGTFIDISGNPTRITLPKDGKYRFEVEVSFAANATGARGLVLYKNGVADGYGAMYPAVPGGSLNTKLNYSATTAKRTAGDYYELYVYQSSGGALDVQARVAVTMVKDETA